MYRTLASCPFSISEEALLRLVQHFSSYEDCCFLHSGEGYNEHDMSYFALFPDKVISIDKEEAPWEELAQEIKIDEKGERLPAYFGFISYEMGGFASHHKRAPIVRKNAPLAYFIRPTLLFSWKRSQQHLKVYISESSFWKKDAQNVIELIQQDRWECLFDEKLSEEVFIEKEPYDQAKQDYQRAYAEIHEHLAKGDIYQVCLTREEFYHYQGSSFTWFTNLCKAASAPFAAYMVLKDREIISLSPERFLKKQGRYIQAEPIKGTIKRNPDPNQDEIASNNLLHCPKNQSELVMITDLMRNDLSKVSVPGSVCVLEHKKLSKHRYLWHLNSLIRGTLDQGYHPIEVLRVTFPPGSISGCPKMRAQEIIFEQEKRPRWVYTGTIGYISNTGDFDFNVAIRTLYTEKNKASVQVGGAILYASDCEEEWQESEVKKKGLIAPIIENAYAYSH